MKLKINNYTDRQNVIIGLINSGYKVWVEETNNILSTEYIVHIEEVNKDSIFDKMSN